VAMGGALSEAVEAARRAAERLAEADDELAIGAASYQQAEAHRVLGQLEAAEAANQVASRRGREPQPGLALLRLAQCRTEAAEAAIRRVLAETGGRLERARLLAAATEILLATGDLGGAREAATSWAGSPATTGPWPWSWRRPGRCWPGSGPVPTWSAWTGWPGPPPRPGG
jgi:hypothetical protein